MMFLRILVGTLGILSGFAAGRSIAGELRDWTVPDSIAVRVFRQLSGDEIQRGSAEYSIASPDGMHFFVTLEHGDLKGDSIVNELHIFSAARIHRSLSGKNPAITPAATLRMASEWPDEFHEPVGKAFWESDTSILFTGTSGSGERGLFRLNIRTGLSERLTSPRHRVISDLEGLAVSGRSLVYAAQDMDAPVDVPESLNTYPSKVIAGRDMDDITWRQSRNAVDAFRVRSVFTSYNGDVPRTLFGLAPGASVLGAWLAPNAKFAIVAAAVDGSAPPASWSAYERQPPLSWYRFMLVDLQAGTAKPVFDAPVGASATSIGHNSSLGGKWMFVNAFWSADSRHVLLLNSALPLNENREERRRMSYLVDYTVGNGNWCAVEALRTVDGKEIHSVQWEKPNSSVRIGYTAAPDLPAEDVIYSFSGEEWVKEPVPPLSSKNHPATQELAYGLTATLKQGANDPPRMLIADGRRNASLFDPDPALRDVWVAPMQTVSWKDSAGVTITGGLVLPRSRKPGKPVPLIVQLYYFQPQLFRPDGTASSAYAAQTLAAHGMAVLYMDGPWAKDIPGAVKPHMSHWEWLTPREFEIVMDNLDCAVDTLSNRGLIDKTKVGIVGWSRGGFLAHYAITHPARTKFAAAAVADSITHGYLEYVVDAAKADPGVGGPGLAEADIYAREYGGGTFWQSKEAWLARSPLFNVDRARTPTLFSMNGIESSIYAMETIGAWRLARRPFEYLMFPTAAHSPRRPRERFELMTSTVEWMDFWLQDKKPVDPGRAARWEKIKQHWQRQ